jgi:hypothetical protein
VWWRCVECGTKSRLRSKEEVLKDSCGWAFADVLPLSSLVAIVGWEVREA